MRYPRAGILVVMIVAVGAAAAAEPFDAPDDGVGCTTLTSQAYDEIPRLFVASAPDSLLTLLDRWDAGCGPHEVITRVRVLGAIWDGAFSEDLYGPDMLADLRKRELELQAGAAPDSARAAFDAFTVALADQLLPHQQPTSLETFFCLFYGGRPAAAWALLDSAGLSGSELARRRARALSRSESTSRWTLGGALGSWYPEGDLDFVGDKPLVGLSAGLRGGGWLLRLVGELRPGRTDLPYWVPRDGADFVSDRWNAWLAGAELGHAVALNGEWELQLFGGLGVDLVRPFGSENLYLDARHRSLGLGLRTRPADAGGWTWGLDLRREWVDGRNQDAVDLGGRAWSLRIAIDRVWNR